MFPKKRLVLGRKSKGMEEEKSEETVAEKRSTKKKKNRRRKRHNRNMYMHLKSASVRLLLIVKTYDSK